MKPRPRVIVRVLSAVLLWLAFGVVVNVLVAWIAVCLPRPASPSVPPITINFQPWPIAAPADWPPSGRGQKYIYPGWDSLVVFAEGSTKLYLVSELRAGVPFRSLRTWDVGGTRGFRAGKDGWAWDVQLPWGGWINLPLAPTWPGFALDSILYAVAGFALWRAVGWVRWRERVERHECPHCGYSRDGLDDGAVCPECGAAA